MSHLGEPVREIIVVPEQEPVPEPLPEPVEVDEPVEVEA